MMKRLRGAVEFLVSTNYSVMRPIKWLDEPEAKDYPAAISYLSLLMDLQRVNYLVKKLLDSQVVVFKAKDIFRASKLSLLGISNYHVQKDVKKISDGKKLSPLLLVQDHNTTSVIVADGYHRLCAVCSVDEDADVPCKITSY